ncbi:MAG: hypothetical protein Fur0010_01780 [Bdellovibrio sp.]
MKMLTFMTFVVLTSHSFARTPMKPAVYTAELRTIDIAQEGHLASGGQVFQHGTVTVDQINQKPKLSIGGRPVCAPGMMCPMVMVRDQNEQLAPTNFDPSLFEHPVSLEEFRILLSRSLALGSSVSFILIGFRFSQKIKMIFIQTTNPV